MYGYNKFIITSTRIIVFFFFSLWLVGGRGPALRIRCARWIGESANNFHHNTSMSITVRFVLDAMRVFLVFIRLIRRWRIEGCRTHRPRAVYDQQKTKQRDVLRGARICATCWILRSEAFANDIFNFNYSVYNYATGGRSFRSEFFIFFKVSPTKRLRNIGQFV